MPYIKDFVSNSNPKHYKLTDKQMADKNTLIMTAEHDEITNQLINSQVGEILAKHGSSGLVHEIHITDQKIYNGFPHMLRIVYEVVPDTEDKAK